MKKIGLLNYQYSNHNYGAVLQAAALHHFINRNLELSCEHIDFKPSVLRKSKLAEIKSSIGSYLMSLGLKQKKINHSSFANSNVFEDFRNVWLPRSSVSFDSFESLQEYDFQYDAVVVGSDQVWRPSYTGDAALVYFLDFLNDDVKRVSYAASFGNDEWELDSEASQAIKSAVSRFSDVSVRESTGVNICRDEFGVNAEHVLDPTLLVGREYFEKIINGLDNDETPSIVYYKLDIDKPFDNFIKGASAELELEPRNIYYQKIGHKYFYHSVESWLNEIKNSKLVVTDSFHCVCFALLFEKPFLYYPNSNRGLTRLESLLALMGLENHILKPGVDPLVHVKQLLEIDYEAVNSRLASYRELSGNFLRKALSV